MFFIKEGELFNMFLLEITFNKGNGWLKIIFVVLLLLDEWILWYRWSAIDIWWDFIAKPSKGSILEVDDDLLCVGWWVSDVWEELEWIVFFGKEILRDVR